MLSLSETNTIGYYNRGNARAAQGDAAGAITDYEHYVALGGGQRDGKQAEAEQRPRALRAQ